MTTPSHRYIVLRALAVAVCGVAVMFPARSSSGAPGRKKPGKVCEAAFKEARKLERNTHLREAKALLVKCARSSCGSFLEHACSVSYSRLESDIPTVVPTVLDGNGDPVRRAWLSIDGKYMNLPIDGRAVEVNPGVHEFAFETVDGIVETQKLLIMQGQHNRPIAATIETADDSADEPSRSAVDNQAPDSVRTAAEPDGHRRVPRYQEPGPDRLAAAPEAPGTDLRPEMTSDESQQEQTGDASTPSKSTWRSRAPYLLGSLGLAGLGGSALLTYWGRKDNAQLAQCSPSCPAASVRHVRTLYVEADVALAVGVSAIAGALWLMAHPGSTKEDVADRRSSLALGVRPSVSGGMAVVSGAF